MEGIKEILWCEMEKENFQHWLENEMEEWKTLQYREYQKIPYGLQEDEVTSVWQQDMYRVLFEKASGYDALFTYLFHNGQGKIYFVDVASGSFYFRVVIKIIGNELFSELRLKERESGEFVLFERYRGLEEKERDLVEEKMPSFFSFYEEVKNYVLTKSPDRLLFLMKQFEFNETYIEKMKRFLGYEK